MRFYHIFTTFSDASLQPRSRLPLPCPVAAAKTSIVYTLELGTGGAKACNPSQVSSLNFFASAGGRWRTVNDAVRRARTSLALMEQLDLVGRTGETARAFGIDFLAVVDCTCYGVVISRLLFQFAPAVSGVDAAFFWVNADCVCFRTRGAAPRQPVPRGVANGAPRTLAELPAAFALQGAGPRFVSFAPAKGSGVSYKGSAASTAVLLAQQRAAGGSLPSPWSLPDIFRAVSPWGIAVHSPAPLSFDLDRWARSRQWRQCRS